MMETKSITTNNVTDAAADGSLIHSLTKTVVKDFINGFIE